MARIVRTELVTGCLPFWVRSRNKTRARRASAGEAWSAKDLLGRAHTVLLAPGQVDLPLGRRADGLGDLAILIEVLDDTGHLDVHHAWPVTDRSPPVDGAGGLVHIVAGADPLPGAEYLPGARDVEGVDLPGVPVRRHTGPRLEPHQLGPAVSGEAKRAERLAGPGRAQELTDAQWQMLLARCPSRSFTIAGDRAQARHGFTESWPQRLERIGLHQITLATLTINYRTPEEVMAEAEPVIRAVLPDANVPASIRSAGLPVPHGSVSELGPVLGSWLAAHADGTACVIGDPAFPATSRVQSLTPELSKGLEFDLVVLINPQAFGTGIEGAVDRYVAMTRATHQLVILTSP